MIIKQNSKVYNDVNQTSQLRFDKTIRFLKANIKQESTILDLGIKNPLSDLMIESGYKVTNTKLGQDLDINYEVVRENYDVVTAFEIFEHMVSPFTLLQAISAPVLVASVPLRLWFAEAYWNESEEWDRHYHEFEPRQFDMLLNKAGWKIKASEKWKSFDNSIGLRPFLRRITDRYYIVYCERQ